MSELAKGLRLEVTDRDGFDQFIEDNAHDPAVHYESWGDNSVPDALYVVKFNHDDPSYYQMLNNHVNSVVTTTYINAELIQNAMDDGLLERDGYDVEFVSENR